MPTTEIARVGVIGAGVMGAAIAAHVANADVPVLLLDVPPAEGGDRDALASAAVARMLKADPAPFMHAGAARLIEVGNTEDDLGRLSACDWIIEAIVERLDIKQALYRRLQQVRRPGTAVSSNTSTIPLARLVEGLGEAFSRDFLITHFFNPPRYMRLLELVTGPATDPDLAARVTHFVDHKLGKTVVRCHDSPGFIANRLGVYWLQLGVVEAMDLGLTVEEADAVMGKPLGIPNTGVFGLLDLVGLDLMPHITASLAGALPAADPFHAANRDIPLIRRLVETGFTGRKGKGGFYRLDRASGRGKEAVELSTGEYRPAREDAPPEIATHGRDPKTLLSAPGKIGAYAWRVLGPTLAYAAALVPEAADDPVAVDTAMKLGYNWRYGPFELIDRLGAGWVGERLAADGVAIPRLLALGQQFYRIQNGRRECLGLDGQYHPILRPEGVLLLEDIRVARQPELKNASASLWDLGDGVACLEATTKMGTFDPGVFELIEQAIPAIAKDSRALVIYNEIGNFSAGANLSLALFAANIAAWGDIDKLVQGGQRAFKALKYAPFPVVAAPYGLALGGGCEIVLNSDAVQAHAETYIGLVECGVGLIPGWGGCGEMIERWRDRLPNGPMPAVAKVFEQVSAATTSKSAAQARELGFLRPGDGITMNRDRLLADAKARALALAENYHPPEPPRFVLPGPSGKLGLDQAAADSQRRGMATPHDVTVASSLATVLSGGDTDVVDTVSEQRLLELERQEFMRLVRTAPTLARIEHVLETGKPLRN
jgi:3-hydroxyacyl-CoA dehydrogenase